MINCLLSFALAVVLCGKSCWCDGAGQELFCKDPDTAQYHPVNSTWRSNTFCGNYTCKVRPKNNTATEYIPYITVNEDKEEMNQKDEVTHEENKSIDKEETLIGKKDTMRSISADLSKIFHKIDKDFKVKSTAQANKIDGDICYKCNEALDPDDDRYLNTEEVNSISKFLYSVKKSDLDALVEMYKIANDLYGEMETSATEDASDVTISTKTVPSMVTQLPQNVQPYYAIQSVPYYNNPFVYGHNKQDYFQDPKPVWNPYTYNAYQSAQYQNIQLQTPVQRLIDIYGQPMQDNSLNKIWTDPSKVYLNPYSSYSGVPPYVHSLNPKYVSPERQSPKSFIVPSAKFGPISTGVSPYSNIYLANPVPNTPQSYYNISAYPYNHLIQVPVHYDATGNKYENGQQPSYIPLTALKFENGPRTNEVLKWKTAPLSPNTLDRVRAHVLQKTPSLLSRPRRLLQPSAPNPLKRIKLEKIGKVLRLEGLKRTKRNASLEIRNDKEHIKEEINQFEETIKRDQFCQKEEVKREENETMETYISSDRCEMATEPGFFRAGDKSLPFPECCPQRLKDPSD